MSFDVTLDLADSAVHAVTLFIQDKVRSKKFYGTTLGLPLIFENDDSAVYRVGDLLINLLLLEKADELISPASVAHPDSGSRFQFTISVEDVDLMTAAIVSRGAHLNNGPVDRPWGIRTSSFCDPDGHIWEICS